MSTLALPLRRGVQDFEPATGAEAVRDKLRLLLSTEPMTMPWRTEFGVGLAGLRHMPTGPVLDALVRVRIEQALAAHAPSVQVREVTARSEDGALFVRISYAYAGERSVLEIER